MKSIFKILRKNKPTVNQLYPELKTSERIEKLIQEYIQPNLEKENFKYLKSTRTFKKKNDFFDYGITFISSRYNTGTSIVRFAPGFFIDSLKYTQWKKSFYPTEKTINSNFCGAGNAGELEYWINDFFDSDWYDLAAYDNEKIMNVINRNIQHAGMTFFNHFSTLDSAILKLKELPEKHLEKIIDLYLIQDKWKEAYEFFESNNAWHEEENKREGSDPNSFYSLNRKASYEFRKKKLINWAQQRV